MLNTFKSVYQVFVFHLLKTICLVQVTHLLVGREVFFNFCSLVYFLDIDCFA